MSKTSLSKERLEFTLALGTKLEWGDDISMGQRHSNLAKIAGCGAANVLLALKDSDPGNLGPDKVEAIRKFLKDKEITDLDANVWLHPSKRAALEAGGEAGSGSTPRKSSRRGPGSRGGGPKGPTAPIASAAPAAAVNGDTFLIVEVSGGGALSIKPPPGLSVSILETSQKPGGILIVAAKIG